MTWRQEIESHYQRVWGQRGQPCQFVAGPISDLPSDFSVLAFPPHESRSMWTYATCCMSQPQDERPLELHIFAPKEANDIVELLVVTAHFHRTAASLGLWDSVNFGRPWLDGSICDHGLVSLPYLDGPDIEDLKIETSAIKCYWLIPVTKAEIEFKKEFGIESLEDRFEKNRLDYINPKRLSVA